MYHVVHVGPRGPRALCQSDWPVSPVDTTDPPANRTCQRCLAQAGLTISDGLVHTAAMR